MPFGLQTFRADGSLDMDVNTMTTRVIGQGVYTAVGTTTINIAVSAGKSLWYSAYVTGACQGNIEENSATQIAVNIVTNSGGAIHITWGEW
jgi:hypothetical protein